MRSTLAALAALAVGALVFAQRGGVDAPIVPIVFQNAAKPAGIDFVLKNAASANKYQIETMPGGVAVLDYDNDGFEDIYFVNGAAVPGLAKEDASYWNRLYRNNGDGTFTDVTAKAGVAGNGYSMAVAAGDYDNDGWDDLFIAGVNRNILYYNNRDGTFSDVTQNAGLAAAGAGKPWSISAGWFDYDNDGWLDLFVVNYCKWAPDKDPYCGENKPGYRAYCHPKLYGGLPNALYHNNRNGTFTDVSAVSGIGAHVGKGMSVAFADYDGDGHMDAFVTNDTERNFLFHNDGNGRFSEVGIRAGVAFNIDGKAVSSMGVDFRDIDGDGLPDLVSTALSGESFSLLRNHGNGLFMDGSYASRLAVLSLPWAGWGVGIFDLNNDGTKDIFTANGHARDNEELYSSWTYRQPNSIFANSGGGRFADVRAGAGHAAARPAAHRGCAFGDFDNDGRVDVVVSCLNEKAELLRNVSDPRQHWFDALLTGRRSNRDAIGAVLKLTSASGAVQYNHVTTAVGYASSSSRRVHFGLGAEGGINNVEIRWPSGILQKLDHPRADECLRITEPE
ncbi:MAG: CRTAC1 family protein [Acidobacteriota bacterium]|nr:CRTAC1 family protein [Acidobacteriota bacterium]